MDTEERLARLETALADHIKLCSVVRNQYRFIVGLVFSGTMALGGWVWHLHEINEGRILALTHAIYTLYTREQLP